MNIREIFGANVRRLRLKQSLSQEKLAEKADLDMTYVSRIERGIQNPTLLVIVGLAAALGLAASVLCEGLDSQPEGSAAR